jgi:tRNA threonylcarbamoyladenosine biosynthesis protein TsaE
MEEKVSMIYSHGERDKIGQLLFAKLATCKIMTFDGPLGAGKTTLIQSILYAAGVTEPIVSPTFTYVNVYKNLLNQTFYHFDLYRIQSLEEFHMAGFDEYLYATNSWALIEWPDIIVPLLTHAVCQVTLSYGSRPDERELHMMCY